MISVKSKLYVTIFTALSLLTAATWSPFFYPAKGAGEAQNNLLVIKGARIIDGKGGVPLENGVVVIEGDRIKSVFRAGEKRIPAKARVIDAAGKTILPGLIDAHVHTGGSAGARISEIEYTPWRQKRDLKAYLYAGVTTVKSLGDDQNNMLELRRMERDGKLVSPRIFTVGKVFTAPSGHPAATIFARATSFVVEGAPPVMKKLSWLFPTRYLVEGLHRVIVEGARLEEIVTNLTVLALTTFVAAFIAAKLFRWDGRERLPVAKKAWVCAVLLVFVVADLWHAQCMS